MNSTSLQRNEIRNIKWLVLGHMDIHSQDENKRFLLYAPYNSSMISISIGFWNFPSSCLSRVLDDLTPSF
jgi:hypothetical protein